MKKKINPERTLVRPKSPVIEIILSEKSVDYKKLGTLVTWLLIKGGQIYIREETIKPNKNLCFGRIQWIGKDSPLFTEPDFKVDFDQGTIVTELMQELEDWGK